MNKLILPMLLLLGSPVVANTVKLATLAPAGSVWHEALRDMGERWNALSDGEVSLQIYPGGVAGDDAAMVRKMRIGQLHAAALTGEGLAAIVPEMRVFQTPMFVRTDAELDYLRSKLGGKLEKLAAEQGFRVLAWSDVGWVYLFSQQPISSPDEARGLKMWIHSGDTAWAEALKDAGYRPVPLPATEIHMGLQSGFIDAFNAPPVVALSSQWFALARNMMDLKWAPLIGAVVVTERQWRQIPSNLRSALQAAAIDATEAAREKVRSFEGDAIAAMQTYGLQVNSVTQDNADRFAREIRASYPKLVGAVVPAAIHEEAGRHLDEYRLSTLK